MESFQKAFVTLLFIITAIFIVLMAWVSISLNLDENEYDNSKVGIATKKTVRMSLRDSTEQNALTEENKEYIIENIDSDIKWLERKNLETPEAMQSALETCNKQLPTTRTLNELVYCIRSITDKNCAEKRAKECYAIEKNKIDSSRYGVTASEFCATKAVIICSDNINTQKSARVSNTPKLRDVSKCTELAEKTGRWNKKVYHECMDTPEEYTW